ncbi:hypothetical protein [Sanxia picorna-like virus 4]|uniref:hypothetical protein n=1 Tax=Sanxia picorna-like virus 4 TaxID=1923373 RepID=UPI00090B3249|nr:hypothetical protein [Sanxia picorna-like virus 4]APG77468.1 hypothetical protein [Sanxia picorna-like virus 4]
MLMETITSLKILAGSAKDKTHSILIQNKLTICYQLLVTYDQAKPLSGLRISPFSMSFYGASSVGKSSSSKMLLTNTLSFNECACSDDHICTIQPTDKFYSTYKANATGVIIDDLSNTRSEKAVVDPAALLISIINNIPYYAPKADTLEKGRIQVRPKVVVVTTNRKDLEAHIWSNEPISVVRRLKYHIEVFVKDEYCRNHGLCSALVKESDVLDLQKYGLQDLWWFKVTYVERYMRSNIECWKFSVVKHGDKLLEKIDIWELSAFINQKSKEHYEEQIKFVENCKDSGLRHVNCKKCFYPKVRCQCVPEPDESVSEPDDSVQGGFFSTLDHACDEIGQGLARYVTNSWYNVLPNYIESIIGFPIIKIITYRYLSNSWFNVTNYVPPVIRDNNYYKEFYVYMSRKRIYINCGIAFSSISALCALGHFRYKIPFEKHEIGGIILSSTLFTYSATRHRILYELKKAPLQSVLPVITQNALVCSIFKVGVSISAVTIAFKVLRSFYKVLVKSSLERPAVVLEEPELAQGNLNPTEYEEILQRDEEVNCWSKKPATFSRNPETLTMTTEQLFNRVNSNVLRLTMLMDNGRGFSIGCVALKSNIFCCPLHFFKQDKNIFGAWQQGNHTCEFDRKNQYYKLNFIKNEGESGSSFTGIIRNVDIVQIGSLDLCIFSVSSGGSFNDIIKYCIFNENDVSIMTIKRDRDGIVTRGYGRAKCCPTSYTIPDNYIFRRNFDIQGGRASYNAPTRDGDCMMTLLRDTISPSIIGFHISSKQGSSEGSYTMFKQHELVDALGKLSALHDVFTPNSGSYLSLSRLGVDLKVVEDIPDKVPVNYIKDHNFWVRGTIGTQVSYFTEIKPSFMCKYVEDIFGFSNIWAGPKFGPQRWKPWYTFLSASSENPSCMQPEILRLATSDYLSPLITTLKNYDQNEKMCPLTHHEIINGIAGKRFIDHINFDSSIGYPLSGKKKKYMQGYENNFDFADVALFNSEFELMKSKYLKDERYYPIFKASLKDEALPRTKDKVRVFQAADITLQYGWRKYGLPILRFLSMYPLLSECAVGVNPYNEEWHQLHNHVTFDGVCNSRIVAGDYKDWDKKLPSQLVLAAFNVIIKIADKLPGYNEEDRKMIKGLATDTTYYLSHFNGTLIEFNCGLPSGHNLTAHINSIANSLLMRYGYYLYKNPAPFRSHCHAITYGDDFECGVLHKIVHFDHLIYRDVVKSLGMILTMPDKTSEATSFLHIDECDFLKRRSIKCDIDNKYYGALDIMSMTRSLMVHGKLKIDKRQHAYSVIRGFVHDLSFHPRDVYEKYIILVRELLDRLEMLMTEANYSYDGYFTYRNRANIDPVVDDYGEDVIDGATIPVGYPVTPEASGNSDFSLNYSVSDSSIPGSFECELPNGLALTNNEIINSYSSTIVMSESDIRNIQDDCIQSQVFGATEGAIDSSLVTSGTAVLTTAADHTIQHLDITSQDMLSMRQDASRDLAYYLSRPIEVARYNPIDNVNSDSTSPLFVFLTRSLIRDKVRYYAYLNAVLHIKVTVVGSPTMAGSQLIALHPWCSRDNGLGELNFGQDVPNYTQCSQLPCIITDLSKEKGGEISMPIICPANGLDITELQQIGDAFKLHYVPLVETRKPLNSAIVPQILVYAWLTDVSLTGTTLTAELPQGDEYTQDNAAKASSDHISLKEMVSKGAGSVVGKATEVGISSLMSAMGFSNPNSQDGINPGVPRLVNNMSCYNGPVNIDSLAGDYKNEVLLDTEQLGYKDDDHMTLNSILGRWSLIGQFAVFTGIQSGPTRAISIPVTPMGCLVETEPGNVVYTPSALGVAALPFTRWRGAITYRFQAIGTAFMKGKIKISHDVKSPSIITNGDKYNTQILNSVIWDLATTTTIDITVPWASNQIFKTCGLLRTAFNETIGDNVVADPDANGALILNQYSVINDNNEGLINILISVKGEPGMAFGDMRPVLANYTFAGIDNTYTGTPQSGEFLDFDIDEVDFVNSNEHIIYFNNGTYKLANIQIWRILMDALRNKSSSDDVSELPQSLAYASNLDDGLLTGNKPGTSMHVNITGLQDNIDDHDTLAMVCMGEKWHSIRQIIKRYTHNWTRNITSSIAGDSYYRIRLPDRPVLKGWQGTKSMHNQPTNVPVTYARDSFLSFYSVCFLGYRGSLRHKVVVTNNHSATGLSHQSFFSVSRSPGGYLEDRVPVSATSINTSLNSISSSASAIPSMIDLRAGATIGHTLINPVLEYSTPFYSRGKFCWAQDRYPHIQKIAPDGGYDVPWHQIVVFQHTGNTNAFRSRIDKYVAAGDDFSLFFYLYGPRMVLNQPNSWPQT